MSGTKTVFCPKCHRQVALVDKDAEGRLTMRRGKLQAGKVTAKNFYLSCPAGHKVKVEG